MRNRVELGPYYACMECFGPLEVAYEFTLRGDALKQRIESGPANIWRYADLLPVPGRRRADPEHESGQHQTDTGPTTLAK